MVIRNIINLVLLNLIVFFTCVQTVTQCPGGMAFLGAPYTIVGDRSNYTGFVWIRPMDERFVVTCNPSCSPVGGYSADMNITHSTLTIDSVRIEDVGTWGISDTNASDPVDMAVDVCQLTAAGIPQCIISSDVDTDSLEPGTRLTLTVDISGYYCSVEAGFDLTTGNVTEEVGMRHNVSDVTDLKRNTTFIVDITRLGDVTMDFICDGRWTVPCNGVQRLLKKRFEAVIFHDTLAMVRVVSWMDLSIKATGPPYCNISSDTDTTALNPGSNLTLTIDIRNYYCSQEAGFDLTTGVITETLLEKQTMDNITDRVLTKSLNITADHIGGVTVTFMCDSFSRPLVCDGVDKLSGFAPSTEQTTVTAPGSTLPSDHPPTIGSPPPQGETVALAVGLSVGAALIIVIAAVVIVRSRRNKRNSN